MSILRMMQVEGSGVEGLLDAALLVRRAGLEHLVTEAEPREVLAMVQAGEILAHERASLAAKAIQQPLHFEALMDGGDKLIAYTVESALSKAAARRAPRGS